MIRHCLNTLNSDELSIKIGKILFIFSGLSNTFEPWLHGEICCQPKTSANIIEVEELWFLSNIIEKSSRKKSIDHVNI